MKALIVAALALAPTSAVACACCAEKGERYEFQSALADYEIEELARLVAKGRAQTFVTACDIDCVGGVENPQYDYDIALNITDTSVELQLPEADASLSLSYGGTYTRYSVDTAPFSEGSSPDLFTELRFDGPLIATGDFAAANDLSAQFILTGTTNSCWSAEHFTHWSLDVESDAVNFRLFGQLGQAD